MNETLHQNHSLQETLTNQVGQYLQEMKEQDITGLYDMVLEQVEQPLFQATIEHCKYNQSKAAEVLGLSRGTLRTKLKKYFDDKYCGTKDE
ncbi:MAG: Fis family transcriptional regulator [Sneathiellales bacterium]|nr:Fis family transcriptional regulator [Sneathiellales bacterium]